MAGISNWCKCLTCHRNIKSGGIAMHRTAHRCKKEYCEIRYSSGKTFIHDYRIKEGDD